MTIDVGTPKDDKGHDGDWIIYDCKMVLIKINDKRKPNKEEEVQITLVKLHQFYSGLNNG